MKFKIFLGLMVLIGTLLGTYAYLNKNTSGSKEVASVVSKLYNDNGKLTDTFNELGVKSASNVSIKQVGNDLVIYFGNQTFKLSKSDLSLQSLQHNLALLGITLSYSTDGSITVYYKGKVVKTLG